MNILKSLTNNFYNPFFQKTVVTMGYKSTWSLKVGRKCSDFHQSDQIFSAFMLAGIETRCKIYKDKYNDDSVSRFFEWLKHNTNKKIKLLSKLVFKICLGYSVLKMGIRRCQIDYVLTGKSLISPLIYSMIHLMYRKIICYMDMDWAAMPDITNIFLIDDVPHVFREISCRLNYS